jgi:hypothetical protein
VEASDNPRGGLRADEGPDDQQERLIAIGWVLGFVDGEGCFSIGLVRQPDREDRKGYRTGFQVSHEFAVTQGEKSVASLLALREFFDVGGLVPNRRHDNHRENVYRYVVRKRVDLVRTVIPFFRRHHLRTAKRSDFEKFAQCVEMIDAGHHLRRDGLIEILSIMQTMNRQKPRHEVIRILRDHTSDTRDIV